MSVPLILAIDIEPDDRVVKATGAGWPGVKLLVDCLMDRRARLQDATGRAVHFNWYLRLDPQIEIAFGRSDWVVDHYAAEIEQIHKAGDALGLHVHTWRPARRWFRRTWLAEFADVDWILHCLGTSIDTFTTRTGAPPRSMSFGDSFMHAAALPLMQEAGIRADFSMNPGMKPHKALGKGELSNGLLPDYRATPRRPFRPAAADFRVPGATNCTFWEIPVTSGIVGRDKDGSDRWTKLLWGMDPNWVRAVTEQALAQPDPYLFAECRTDVLTHPGNRDRYMWALDYYETLARSTALEFMHIEAFCDRLDRGEVAVAA